MAAQHGGGRVWLDVPYAEKDQAKTLGARWDQRARRWFAGPAAQPELLARWAARPEVPELLPGEDRSFGAGLQVDMIPATVWWSNVRSHCSQGDWERLRRMLIGRAGARCELCGRGEDRAVARWLEAHERFAYDDRTGTQALRRLILVCTWCHQTTHFGLSQISGRAESAFAHLCAVTGMTDEQAQDHIDAAFALWRTRSDRTWTLDLSMLTTAGIALHRPDDTTAAGDHATLPARPGTAPRDRAGSGYERLMREYIAELGGDPDAPIPTPEETLASVEAAAAAHHRASPNHTGMTTPHRYPGAPPPPATAPAVAGSAVGERWRRWIGRGKR